MGKAFSGGIIPANVATQYNTDSGTAVPSAGILNVFGGTGVSTSGAGNTVTVTTSQNPTNIFQAVDDFIQHSTGYGQLDWRVSGNSITDQVDGTALHPGLIQLTNQNTNGGIYLAAGTGTHFPFVLGNGEFTLNVVLNLVTLGTAPNDYTFRFGLGDTLISTGTIANGVFFSYNFADNGGQWVGNCMSASVSSTSNSSIAVATGFVNLGITINAAATSVTFTVNGVQFASAITTNIPTTSLGPFVWWLKNAGSLPAAQIDLFYMKNTLTTTR